MNGQVSVAQLKDAISDTTSIVSIMWGNNEIGTLQPIAEIADVCAGRGLAFHCDAAQAAGKVPIDLSKVAISMLTLSAHKFYGPKGAGALFVRDLNNRVSLVPRVFGGGQEKGLRAGTLNVPCIVGMGAACSMASRQMSVWCQHTQQLRDRFESKAFDQLDDISLNGSQSSRLPHISNIAFHGTDSLGLLTLVPEVVASTGSACHVADFHPSHVLTALPAKRTPAECSLRFGFGKDNSMHEVDTATSLLCAAVHRLRTSE